MTLSLPILRGSRSPAHLSEGRPATTALPAAPAEARQPGRLIDSHGRTIRDLRLSITDRCNFRCVYCMDPDVRFMDQSELLGTDEIVRLAGICARMGVRKVRLTGGEPTLQPDLERIIAGIAGSTPLQIALTTNGSRCGLPELTRWRAAGLHRVSISIDSLRPERFAKITRSRTTPANVLDAIAAAKAAGLEPVKVNAVVVRGFNEDEVADLAGLARRFGIEMRFIEYMPLDSGHGWDRGKVVAADEIIARIAERHELVAEGRDDPSSTSLSYRFADGAPGRIGVIAPVSRPFCGACSRLRITADGKVRPCLFSRTEWDVRPLLRSGADDERLVEFLADVTWTKQAGHGISSAGFEQPERTMSAIGG
jgi:cyclic pyranopterin phosphate synthase